jgi:hypothetical protein
MRCALPTLLVLSACNQPPSTPEIDIGPDAPTTTDALTLLVTQASTDENKKNIITSTIFWYKDGVQQPFSGETVNPVDTKKGQVWRVELLPSDGKDDGVAGWAEVTIANTPPTAEVTRTGGKSLFTDDDLSVQVATDDIDGDDVTVSYSWTVDGEASSHDGPTVPAADTLKGQTWVVQVTPTDDQHDGEFATTDFVIVNTMPSVAAARIDPQAVTTTTDVACSGAAWKDIDTDDPETYRTVWRVNNVTVAEGDVLSSDNYKRGDKVSCQLFPKDEDSEGSPVSSAAVTVRNSAPTVTSFELEPTGRVASKDDTLRIKVTGYGDADGDMVIMTYEWQVNTKPVSEGNFLRSDAFKTGDVVHLKLKPFDGLTFGGPYWYEWTINNSTPTQPVVAIEPVSPTSGDDLWCDITTASTDADGDTVTYGFQWEKDGVPWTGAVSDHVHTGDTVPSSETSDGEDWTCVVTPDDKTDFGVDGTHTATVTDP